MSPEAAYRRFNRELRRFEIDVGRQLIVLKSTRIPAVLLEAGSIVNRDEELVVSKPASMGGVRIRCGREGAETRRAHRP